MDYLFQRVSYLKGLVEGLKIEENTDEGKVLLAIIDTLEDFAEAMNGLAEDQEELENYVSFIDEDLTDVEEELYGVTDDDLEDFEDYDDLENFEDYDEFFEDDGEESSEE